MRTKTVTIVTENYPVAKLPPDLQEGFDLNACVTVTIEYEEEIPDLTSQTEADLA